MSAESVFLIFIVFFIQEIGKKVLHYVWGMDFRILNLVSKYLRLGLELTFRFLSMQALLKHHTSQLANLQHSS